MKKAESVVLTKIKKHKYLGFRLVPSLILYNGYPENEQEGKRNVLVSIIILYT